GRDNIAQGRASRTLGNRGENPFRPERARQPKAPIVRPFQGGVGSARRSQGARSATLGYVVVPLRGGKPRITDAIPPMRNRLAWVRLGRDNRQPNHSGSNVAAGRLFESQTAEGARWNWLRKSLSGHPHSCGSLSSKWEA